MQEKLRSCSVAFAAVAIAGAAALSGCSSAAPAVSSRSTTSSVDQVGPTVFPAQSRALLPTLAGSSLDGTPLTAQTFAGKGILVINVWASWCEPCRTEVPELAAAATELASSGVSFLGIDEQDPPNDARTFLANAGATYPQLGDPDGALLARLSVLPADGIPSTVIVDKSGHMAARVVGQTTSAQLQQLIAQLSGE
jgi:thiol-disulfide isomerase/thioredoxin